MIPVEQIFSSQEATMRSYYIRIWNLFFLLLIVKRIVTILQILFLTFPIRIQSSFLIHRILWTGFYRIFRSRFFYVVQKRSLDVKFSLFVNLSRPIALVYEPCQPLFETIHYTLSVGGPIPPIQDRSIFEMIKDLVFIVYGIDIISERLPHFSSQEITLILYLFSIWNLFFLLRVLQMFRRALRALRRRDLGPTDEVLPTLVSLPRAL